MTDSLDFGPYKPDRPAPDTTPKVPLARQIACVERELVMRRRVYAGLIRTGKMSPQMATVEIENMEGVLSTLQAVRKLFSKIS
jgi:hypothetical protein